MTLNSLFNQSTILVLNLFFAFVFSGDWNKGNDSVDAGNPGADSGLKQLGGGAPDLLGGGRDGSEEGEGGRGSGASMIGVTGSRHMGGRRRSSLAVPSLTSSYLGRLSERTESGSLGGIGADSPSSPRLPAVPRRRAVDTSDLRSCALVQTKMKTWKNYPE